jgi:hypothetical protein
MRWVLHTIADAANRDGENARPGMQAIVEGSLFSVGHVRRTLSKLIDEGWLEVTERGGGEGHESVYRVIMNQPEDAHGERQSIQVDIGPNAQMSRVWMRDNDETAPITSYTDTVKKPSERKRSGSGKATDDPVKKYAHALTTLAFEQSIKPTLRDGGVGAFPAVMSIIERLLRSGMLYDHLRNAILDGIDVWTVAGIQTAVAKAKPRRNPLERGGPSLQDKFQAALASEISQPSLGA